MSNRKSISPNEDRSLIAEVNGFCPLCNAQLLFIKNNKKHKNYEIAHIYPCNPTKEQVKILKNCERLSDNSEDEINKIAICLTCHNKIDCERTVEEYEKLVNIKKNLLEKKSVRAIFNEISLQDDLIDIINSLVQKLKTPEKIKINNKAVKIKNKITDPLLRNKIRENVADYYKFIDNYFKSCNLNDKQYEIILSNFRLAYLKISENEDNQEKIFENMVDWLLQQSKKSYRFANYIIISYFVHHCEVYDDIS